MSTFPASVQGVSGRYGCYNSTTNAACKVHVEAAYSDVGGTTDAREELATLTIKPEPESGSGAALYFDPGSGTISLLNVAKTGAPEEPEETDRQYITFGWWQERPALVDGMYQAAVFAEITSNIAYSSATGSAEYEGPAVGFTSTARPTVAKPSTNRATSPPRPSCGPRLARRTLCRET